MEKRLNQVNIAIPHSLDCPMDACSCSERKDYLVCSPFRKPPARPPEGDSGFLWLPQRSENDPNGCTRDNRARNGGICWRNRFVHGNICNSQDNMLERGRTTRDCQLDCSTTGGIPEAMGASIGLMWTLCHIRKLLSRCL